MTERFTVSCECGNCAICDAEEGAWLTCVVLDPDWDEDGAAIMSVIEAILAQEVGE